MDEQSALTLKQTNNSGRQPQCLNYRSLTSTICGIQINTAYYPPILVATNPENGNWQLYDAYTGDSLFNVTGVPSGTVVAGPNGEQLRYVIANDGTATNPQWYLSEWNSSKLWQYDINPYTGTGSLSPAVINENKRLPNRRRRWQRN